MSEKLCTDEGDSGEVVLDVGSQETTAEAKGFSEPMGLAEPACSTSGLFSPPSPVLSTSKSRSETSLSKRKSFSRSLLSKPTVRFAEPSMPFDPDVLEEEKSLDHQVGAMSPSRSPYYHGSPEERFPMSDEDTFEHEVEEKEICKKIIHRKGISRLVLIGWIIFLCTGSVLVASRKVHKLENLMFWSLELWKWCVLVLVIFCGMLVTDWFMYLMICVLERSPLLRVKVLYYVDEMKKSVQVFIWFALILLTWILLINRDEAQRSKTVTKILHYVTWSLVSAVIGALLWSVKVLLVKILESNFYVNAFFDRVHELIFCQHILRRLSGLPIMDMDYQKLDRSTAAETSFRTTKAAGKEITEVIIDVRKLLKMKLENISGLTKKVLVDAVSTLELSFTSESDILSEEPITSETEAVQAAKYIFYNVVRRGSRGPLEFLVCRGDALSVYLTNTATSTQGIKKKALRKWMLEAYNGHKRLVHSLSDTKAAIKRLDKLVTSILVVITILVWLVLVEIATTKVLLFISSQLVLAVFIFGNTCKSVFEAIMFLFVVHPFDVGDRCVVDGVEMLVEEMNILTTVFVKLNNDKVYYPNSVLSTLPISNCQTNTDSGDKLKFSIQMPSVEKLGALKMRVKKYFEYHPEYWNPRHDLLVAEIHNGMLEMALSFDYNNLKFHEFEEKTRRRSSLIIELMQILEELGIRCHFVPPQEVYVHKAWK